MWNTHSKFLRCFTEQCRRPGVSRKEADQQRPLYFIPIRFEKKTRRLWLLGRLSASSFEQAAVSDFFDRDDFSCHLQGKACAQIGITRSKWIGSHSTPLTVTEFIIHLSCLCSASLRTYLIFLDFSSNEHYEGPWSVVCCTPSIDSDAQLVM